MKGWTKWIVMVCGVCLTAGAGYGAMVWRAQTTHIVAGKAEHVSRSQPFVPYNLSLEVKGTKVTIPVHESCYALDIHEGDYVKIVLRDPIPLIGSYVESVQRGWPPQ